VTLTPGESVVIDGVTYTADDSVKKFYLGTFKTTITTGNNAEISGGQPKDPGYLQQYTVKITPKTNFDLDKDNFTVTMKKSDKGVTETLKFSDVCTVDADGSKINSGQLEMSNVDLSGQFTDMIITQRGFQANSRVITVSDTLLEELINLKR
jgi:flagellar basal body rod protein FlgG